MFELALIDKAVALRVDCAKGIEGVRMLRSLYDEVEHEDEDTELYVADLHSLPAPNPTLNRTTRYKHSRTPTPRSPRCPSTRPRTQACSNISPTLIRFSKFFYNIRVIRCLTSPDRVYQIGLSNLTGSLRMCSMIYGWFCPTKGALPERST